MKLPASHPSGDGPRIVSTQAASERSKKKKDAERQ